MSGDFRLPGGHLPSWGMVVDLNRCVGCQTCTVACRSANDTLLGVQWRRVIDVELGRFPDVERLFMVVGCQHCEEPPCVPVCPTGATAKRADGIVTQDYDLCIGCGYCAVACPYQARTIAYETTPAFAEGLTLHEDAVAHPERLGVAQKCNFCSTRVDAGLAQGLVPGVDPTATPACAAACIADAIKFGDFNDPNSNVSRLSAANKTMLMHEELGTKPKIRYLYETPAHPGRDNPPDDADDANPASPLVGKRQQRWDFRAAMNFGLGGAGSGFAVVAYGLHLMGWLSVDAFRVALVVAGAFMAVGLFFVFLEIGRKLRFLNALLRPQSSWMTREIYVVGVFYASVGASLLWPMPALFAVAAAAAAAFLYCQARILNAGKGIPAWRAPLIRPMILATGLLEGAGIAAYANAAALGSIKVAGAVAWGGLVLVALNAVLWHSYRKSARANGIPPLARADIDETSAIVHGVGHAMAAAFFAGGLMADGFIAVALIALGGAAAFAGGLLWKFVVITRACHTQGFALPKVPRRGSGNKAAPVSAGALAVGRAATAGD